jgi:hypothetical protein
MKFIVDAILPSMKFAHRKDGDMLFVEDCKARINGVDHQLYYGDIVQCGEKYYCVNENKVTPIGFDNAFRDFWHLENGGVPKDGEWYFVLKNEGTVLSADMKFYDDYVGMFVNNDETGVLVKEVEGNKIFCETTETPYIIEGGAVSEYNTSLNSFTEAVRLFEEKRDHEAQEQLLAEQEASERLLEQQKWEAEQPLARLTKEELIELIVEKAMHDIELRNGKDGDQGPPGRDGKHGKDGKDGNDGRDGRDGVAGPKGDKGDQGEKGESGEQGPSGKEGPKGEQGEKGERGPAGPPGITEQRIVTEQAEIDAVSKQEWEKFQKLDQLYKQRLNTQLSSLGGGGSDALMENRDVAYVDPSQLSNGQFLAYNSTTGLFALTDISVLQGGANSDSTYPVYIQNSAPTTSATKYMWIETAAGGDNTCFSIWFNDGL